MYHIAYLEIALKDKKDSNIYAFENVSHIPTSMLVRIFKIDLKKDPDIMGGYFLTQACYKAHRKYIDKHIGATNLKIFEYCLRFYVGDAKSLRMMYKENKFE